MKSKLDCDPLRLEFIDRVDVARRLVEATDPLDQSGGAASSLANTADISREARGLAVLLLFAAYENLLTSTCRTLLETAARSRARARRLKPGVLLFLVHDEIKSLAAGGPKQIWKKAGPKLVDAILNRPAAELDMGLFPHDGSYMKTSQISLLCELFDFGNPAIPLKDLWNQIDGIVGQRNGIAHGRLTPAQVGRNYTRQEILDLIDLWQARWIEFLAWLESKCQGSSFYLMGR